MAAAEPEASPLSLEASMLKLFPGAGVGWKSKWLGGLAMLLAFEEPRTIEPLVWLGLLTSGSGYCNKIRCD